VAAAFSGVYTTFSWSQFSGITVMARLSLPSNIETLVGPALRSHSRFQPDFFDGLTKPVIESESKTAFNPGCPAPVSLF